MAAHAFNPNTQKGDRGWWIFEFKASQGYVVREKHGILV